MKFENGFIKLKYIILRSKTIADYYFIRIFDEAQIHAEQLAWNWNEKERKRVARNEIVGAGFIEALTNLDGEIEENIDMGCFGLSTSCNVKSRYSQDLVLMDQERLYNALKEYYHSSEKRFNLDFYCVHEPAENKSTFFEFEENKDPFTPFKLVDGLNDQATECRSMAFNDSAVIEEDSYTQPQLLQMLKGNIYYKEVRLDTSRKKNKKSTYRSFYVPSRHYLDASRLTDKSWENIEAIQVDDAHIKQAGFKLVKTGVY